jgi:hypothetical protein
MTSRSGLKVIETLNGSGKRRLEKQIDARIQMRMDQGWSIEKIAHRTCWTMFGLQYTIKGNILARPMIGANAYAVYFFAR